MRVRSRPWVTAIMHAGYGIQINTDGKRFVQEHLG